MGRGLTIYFLTGSRRINFKDKSTVMNLVLIVLGIIFGLIMIIMGSLHADRFLITTIIMTIIKIISGPSLTPSRLV